MREEEKNDHESGTHKNALCMKKAQWLSFRFLLDGKGIGRRERTWRIEHYSHRLAFSTASIEAF